MNSRQYKFSQLVLLDPMLKEKEGISECLISLAYTHDENRKCNSPIWQYSPTNFVVHWQTSGETQDPPFWQRVLQIAEEIA